MLFETEPEALAAGRQHLLSEGASTKSARWGWWRRRQFRKQQRPPWEERRRD